MADTVEKIIFDDTDLLNSLKDIVDWTGKADKAMDDLNDTVEKGSKKASDDFVKNSKKVDDSLTKTAELQRKATKETEDNIKNTRVWGISLNEIKEKLNIYKSGLISTNKIIGDNTKLTMTQKRGVIQLSTALGIGTKGFVGLAKAINIAKVALVTSGIGLAVIAVGSLTAALTTSQKGFDKLGQANAYITTSFDVLVDKASKLGERILDNDNIFVGAAKTLLGPAGILFGYTSLGKEMDEAGKKAAAIRKEFQRLAREQSDANVTTAVNRKELERYKLISEDTTKSLSERIEAVTKANELEQDQLNTQIRLSAEKLELTKQDAENRKKDDLTSNLIAQNNLTVELANLEAESLTKQTELQNKLNSLKKEYNDKLLAAQMKLKTITENVTTLAGETSIISDREFFNFARDKQVENLKAMKNELLEISKVTGQDIAKEVKILDQAIAGVSNLEFVKEIEKLPTKIKKSIESIGTDGLKLSIDVEVSPESKKGFVDYLDILRTEIDDFLSTDLGQGLSDLFSTFNGLINESTNIQIEGIDKRLEKLTERREKLQEGLDQEQKDFEKGLASSVSGKQEQVDALIAEEVRLDKEKEKLQSDAQKRQIKVDTLSQSQSLITSSINIIKGFSQIPIFGLPLGIAAVGSLLAFFAKTKIDAIKATRLSTGANKISDYFGFGERYGETDLNNGPGYTLVNNKTGKSTNTIISGREMIIPENVSISNEGFFNSMKNGLYDGINLNDAMSFYMQHSGSKPKNDKSTHSVKISHTQEAKSSKVRQYVPYVDKDGQSKAILVTIKPGDRDGSKMTLE